MTYSSITTLTQDLLSRSCSQRLGTGDYAIGTVDSTPSAGERGKVRIGLGVHGSGTERHDEISRVCLTACSCSIKPQSDHGGLK